jgi:hypothetical protein
MQYWQSGKTALHFAAEKGNVEVSELLILSGAIVEIQDKVSQHCKRQHTIHTQVDLIGWKDSSESCEGRKQLDLRWYWRFGKAT